MKDGKVAISPAQLAALTGTRPLPPKVWESKDDTNPRSTSPIKTSKSKQERISVGKILTKKEIKAKELAAAIKSHQERGNVKEVLSFSEVFCLVFSGPVMNSLCVFVELFQFRYRCPARRLCRRLIPMLSQVDQTIW